MDHEPRAADQVPLLLTMKEDQLALTKAVDSGDTDLGSSWKLPSLKYGYKRGGKHDNSVPCSPALTQTTVIGDVFPAHRGRWAAVGSCVEVTAGLCTGAESGNVERFLLFG